MRHLLSLHPNTDFYPDTKNIVESPDQVIRLWKARNAIELGVRAAESNKLKESIQAFSKAQKSVPDIDLDMQTSDLDIDPEKVAKSIISRTKIADLNLSNRIIYYETKVQKTLRIFEEAQELNPDVYISPLQWNLVCRFGGTNNQAQDVLNACDNAVNADPERGRYRDSRGIARALTGDIEGAIADFQAYIEWEGSPPRRKQQRMEWIKTLEKGENPFTEEVLLRLRY